MTRNDNSPSVGFGIRTDFSFRLGHNNKYGRRRRRRRRFGPIVTYNARRHGRRHDDPLDTCYLF
jgi:hypothetical protein